MSGSAGQDTFIEICEGIEVDELVAANLRRLVLASIRSDRDREQSAGIHCPGIRQLIALLPLSLATADLLTYEDAGSGEVRLLPHIGRACCSGAFYSDN